MALISGCLFTKMLQLLGDSRPPAGALPLDPTGGLPSYPLLAPPPIQPSRSALGEDKKDELSACRKRWMRARLLKLTQWIRIGAQVNLSVTADRQILYDHIINKQRQTTTGRLHTKDTFDLYKTFVAMAETDEASGRQRPHEVRIDQEVDEQRLLDLQITAFRPVFH